MIRNVESLVYSFLIAAPLIVIALLALHEIGPSDLRWLGWEQRRTLLAWGFLLWFPTYLIWQRGRQEEDKD